MIWTKESIREYRLSLGMTIPQFAKILGVGVTTIKYWEGGQRIPYPAYRDKLDTYKRRREGCTCRCHPRPTIPRGEPWSLEDHQDLYDTIDRGDSIDDLLRLFEQKKRPRTREAVVQQAKKLGVSFVPDLWLSTSEAGRLLGVGRHTVVAMIDRGELSAERYTPVKTGQQIRWWRIHREEVQRYLKESISA